MHEESIDKILDAIQTPEQFESAVREVIKKGYDNKLGLTWGNQGLGLDVKEVDVLGDFYIHDLTGRHATKKEWFHKAIANILEPPQYTRNENPDYKALEAAAYLVADLQGTDGKGLIKEAGPNLRKLIDAEDVLELGKIPGSLYNKSYDNVNVTNPIRYAVLDAYAVVQQGNPKDIELWKDLIEDVNNHEYIRLGIFGLERCDINAARRYWPTAKQIIEKRIADDPDYSFVVRINLDEYEKHLFKES